jgi:hypothetical protein
MNTSISSSPALARDVKISATEVTVHLTDGRTISVPLVWYPRLLAATPAQRDRWELLGNGEGIHWPDLDEDLSVGGFLRGARAPAPRRTNAA